YLGERVRMQTVGAFWVLKPPPATMLSTHSIGESWRVYSRTGVPATELVIAGASYYQFIQDSLRLPEPGVEYLDPLLGGWVPPDARISYTGESGSEIVETVPEDRVFHAPLPEGVQATGVGRAGADDAGPSGGGRGREERERAQHSPLRHRRSDVGTSSSGE
ncbi:hypothetical protein SOVF_161860, partial [Spinacia oleracea]